MYNPVSPDYFRALGIPLLRGRPFTDQDSEDAPWVAVISEKLARLSWPNEDPIGQHITVRDPTGKDERPREIVGIVGDVRKFQLDREPGRDLYVPYGQQLREYRHTDYGAHHYISLAVRSTLEPGVLTAAVRRAVAELGPDLPVYKVRTMDEILDGQVVKPRFYLLLLGIFAGVAVILAAGGIYGVMAYVVTCRTQEIGIRMALGAGRGDVLRLVVRGGMIQAAVGVALGLAAAYGLTRFIAGWLYGVKPTDPATLGAVSMLLLAVALAACYLPARRAARVDPMVALRTE